jgi:hypothetical protein
MPYFSFVFSVAPGRVNRYKLGVNNLEVKAVAAIDMEVLVATQPPPPAAVIETRVLRNDIRLGTSIIIDSNAWLEVFNPQNSGRNGYIGATRP